jgi:drug/metabolite transporter (DMT)-like permease
MLSGGVALTVIGSIAYSPSELDPSSWSGRSVFGLVYLIVFGSLLGYSAYVWLLANAPISKVSTYAYVNPVVAIALGVIVLDESGDRPHRRRRAADPGLGRDRPAPGGDRRAAARARRGRPA